MEISYLGTGAVKLSGNQLNIICDPTKDMLAKTDVVTLSSIEPEDSDRIYSRPAGVMVIDGPGQYEVKGATIVGVPARLHIDETGQRGAVYSIVIDGVNVVVTGNIAGKLDEDTIESLGQVDVLVIPVGGGGLTLDATGAAAVVTQLEPSYVIPVHYNDGLSVYPVPQAGVELFLQEMGASVEAQTKFRVVRSEAPAETQVVLLSPANS